MVAFKGDHVRYNQKYRLTTDRRCRVRHPNKKSPQQAAGYWWKQIRTGLTVDLHEVFCMSVPGSARTFLSSPRRRACPPYLQNTHPTKIPRPTTASSPAGTAET